MRNTHKTRFVIIIGAMKAGTTSLYDLLIQHSQVAPCALKESEYFSKNHGKNLGVSRYEDLWQFEPSAHKWALEASPGYSKFPFESGVPERIFQYGLRPKFIYILRDPVARIESHFNHTKHYHYYTGFHQESLGHAINVSNYYLQLKQYAEYFSADDFLLLDYDDLRNAQGKLVSSVCDFLQLPVEPLEPKHSNPYEQFSKAEVKLLKSSLLSKIAPLVPSSVRVKIRQLLSRLSDPEPRFQLSENHKDMIREKLAEDMKKLNAEYGVNTQQWGF